MYYDALSKNTVKITLTRRDMKTYSIKSENLVSRTAESKRCLICFLKKFQSESSLFPGYHAERLFLEAFPSDDGGCVMYVSTLGTDDLPPEEEKSPVSRIMCRTDSIDDAATLCRIVSGAELSSALYSLDSEYCLIFSVPSEKTEALSRIIGEFGAFSDEPTDIACVSEHAEAICETDAIKLLTGLYKPRS